MKALEGKTRREKILLTGLAVAMVFSSYLLFRVKHLNLDIKKIDANIISEKKDYNKLVKKTGNIKPSHVLNKEIASMEKKLEQERQNLQGMDLSFVDLRNQEALHGLIADITLTAEKFQLQVLGKQNELTDLTTLVKNGQPTPTINKNNKNRQSSKNARFVNPAGSTTATQDNNLKRHLFKIKIRGSFHSTYDFIKSLKNMEYGVLIARLKLTAEDLNTYNGQRLITTDLTLAI